MKEYRIMILLVSTLFTIAMSCSSQLDNEDFSDMIGKGQNYTPPPVPVEEPTLKDKEGWKIDSIDGKSFISLGKYISERNKTVRRRSFFILALSVFSVLPLYYKTS